MKEAHFLKPHEVHEFSNEFHHKLELKEKGVVVGFADFEYYNKPFPYYYISFVFVNKKRRGEGVGSEIIEELNQFLESKGKAGILLNSISNSQPTQTIYKNHGWTEVKGKQDWYTYNLPKELAEGSLEKAIYTIDEHHKGGDEKPKAA